MKALDQWGLSEQELHTYNNHNLFIFSSLLVIEYMCLMPSIVSLVLLLLLHVWDINHKLSHI